MDKIIKIMGQEAGHKVYILGNKCYRCKHIWTPRDIDEKPAVCPSCKSPYWDRPKQEKNKTANPPKKSRKSL